jgi:hypothetical protein
MSTTVPKPSMGNSERYPVQPVLKDFIEINDALKNGCAPQVSLNLAKVMLPDGRQVSEA